MGKFRIGFIGCGEISIYQAKGISQANNAEIGMVMDVVPTLAQDLGEKYQVPYTTDVDELLAQEDIHGIYVAVPHYLHAPMAIKAAQAGKHVMVEKPIAISLQDADAMIEAAKESGVLLSVCYILRYLASSIKAKELIDKGAIGEVIGIKMMSISDKSSSYWHGGYSGRAKSDWRTIKEKSGGGVLIMNISHNIDLMRYLTGLEAKEVYSDYDTFLTPVEVEDMIVTTLRYDNGAIGLIEAGSCMRGGHPFNRNYYGDRIYGTEGQIMLGNPLMVYTTKEIDGLEKDKWQEIQVDQSWDTRTKYTEKFVDAVRRGIAPPITGEDGKRALEIVDAAYRSGKEKRMVNINNSHS